MISESGKDILFLESVREETVGHKQRDKQTDQLFFSRNEVRRRTLTEIGSNSK